MSLCRIAAKQSPPKSRMRSGKARRVGREDQVGALVADDQLARVGEAEDAVDAEHVGRAGTQMARRGTAAGRPACAASTARRMTWPRRRRFSAVSNSRTRSSASSSISISLSRSTRKRRTPGTAKPGNSDVEKRAISCSSGRNRRRSPGRRMKRSSWAGSRTSAVSVLALRRGRAAAPTPKPRLATNGNGCAGSIASGVRTGNSSARKRSSSQARSPVRQLARRRPPRCRPRAARRAARASSAAASAISAPTRSLIASSCCAGVRPSGARAS